ncbi:MULTISPECIES: alpha/beta hydrolase [unclassified Cryobacterium]|uniref:alpha/beta fold hydrolase n=2 Tax=Cryobacterium TaxID=69578 RepID=UPI002AB38D10|nr:MULTISPECIES: alpha/beta hydrolase [unclassified Cryobacterium]MDY7527100.1 alpha/beta hydrolase [Cryobacterium sp. 10C2]MDY7557114.1 alpha/beta hydrolase [Cryobacterium sp. 10C3]MEB0003624.1 alpha/beta hydrolase [Cryobacterium sp. RTC2.1]MEB0286228.1 alpha/beta hydrolase [Cryobacterium sp. 10S3]MEB0290270.1 alpha/beta hydrolase [Cryobacterium sp. 10C2]
MSIRERRRGVHRPAGVIESDARDDPAAALDLSLPDRDWTGLPPGARAFRFEAPSGSLAALAWGEPGHPRVVLVPGATGSKEDFVLLAPLLAGAGYFVESYDLAGQYGSAGAGPGAGQGYDYRLFTADLVAVLDAGATPAHVLGYSFAGIVAEIALATHPELFASLVLLGAPPLAGQAFRGVRWIGPLSWLLPAHTIASLMVWGLVTNRNHAPPGRLHLVRLRFEDTIRRSVDEIMELMKNAPDLRADLARSRVPLLVAVGERDLWPLELHRAFAGRIGAQLRVYRTGHSPCETTPHQLARDLLALYARS